MVKTRLLSSVALCGCVGLALSQGHHRDVISVHNIMGTAHVTADDGTGAGGVAGDAGPQHPSVDVRRTMGRSSAHARVGDWYVVAGKAFADIGAPGPKRIATAEMRSNANGEFSIKSNNDVTLNVTAEILVLLRSGRATIQIDGTITQGRRLVAQVRSNMTLEVDVTDPTGKTIKITGGSPAKMRNGGHTHQTVSPQNVTLAPGDYQVHLMAYVKSEGDTQADVTLQEAHLTLH